MASQGFIYCFIAAAELGRSVIAAQGIVAQGPGPAPAFFFLPSASFWFLTRHHDTSSKPLLLLVNSQSAC
jgi:hypothetical protein